MTQRQMASELGLSLGKTNYVVRALVDKGWVKLSNFKRSDNKLGYLYLLTPEGVTEKSILAQNFLNRKSIEYNRLKKEIEKLNRISPSSAEYTVSRTYIDWILDIPWSVSSEDTIEIAAPADLAYGPRGKGPIPGGATLLFTVQLLGIEPAA